MTGRLLTSTEAAERLNVKPGTVRGWIAKGKLTVCRIHGCVRIPEHVVEQLIKDGMRPAVTVWRS